MAPVAAPARAEAGPPPDPAPPDTPREAPGPGAGGAPEEEREEFRAKLRRLHQREFALRDGIESAAQHECCRYRVPRRDVEVWTDGESGRMYSRGLKRCGSVWSCPTCAPGVCRSKGRELEELLEALLEAGGEVVMFTCTLPHHSGHRLEHSYKAVSEAWSYVKGGRRWRELADRLHYLGAVRAVDATHGPNGWHPHLHNLVAFAEPPSEEELEELEELVTERWCKKIERAYLGELPGGDGEEGLRWWNLRQDLPEGFDPMFGRPSAEHGVTMSAADRDAGHYVSKVGLGKEASRIDVKKAAEGHRTPFEILADYYRHRRPEDARKWLEWSRVMKGKRQVVNTIDADEVAELGQADLELEENRPDAERADETGPEDERNATVKSDVWDHLENIVANPPEELAGDLYDDAEAQVHAWLRRWSPEVVAGVLSFALEAAGIPGTVEWEPSRRLFWRRRRGYQHPPSTREELEEDRRQLAEEEAPEEPEPDAPPPHPELELVA